MQNFSPADNPNIQKQYTFYRDTESFYKVTSYAFLDTKLQRERKFFYN